MWVVVEDLEWELAGRDVSASDSVFILAFMLAVFLFLLAR